MSYKALYRTYRPQTFSEVAGQDHITKTLKNQIRSGSTTHAYLFCGSRGTGKTSTAKILARAVNCDSPEDGEPCMKCSSCKASAKDHVDIIEMDAASNSKVEEMRDLLKKVDFMPLQLNKKIYIIDEAHMLSNSAFNALLKTLEEPPSHVVFILATTEPQKLPATIISRCQRFDFHRLRVDEIVRRMEEVLSIAGAEIERDGLVAIARAADGGMRDALSLLDQCLAFCKDHVTTKDVLSVLGSMEEDFLFRVADALIEGDASNALRLADEIIVNGRDPGVFMQDLAIHFRALLLTEICGDSRDILDCTADTMQKYAGQAKRSSRERLMRAIRLLLEAQGKLRWISFPRILMESTLVRICEPEQEVSLEALTDRVERLEKTLSGKELSAVSDKSGVKIRKETHHFEETGSSGQNRVGESGTAGAPPLTENDSEKSVQANEVWNKLMSFIAKDNMPLYCLMNYAKHVKEENGMIYACFDKDSYIGGIKRHNAYLQNCINSFSPGTKLKFELIDCQENALDKAKALFGSKLEIVD